MVYSSKLNGFTSSFHHRAQNEIMNSLMFLNNHFVTLWKNHSKLWPWFSNMLTYGFTPNLFQRVLLKVINTLGIILEQFTEFYQNPVDECLRGRWWIVSCYLSFVSCKHLSITTSLVSKLQHSQLSALKFSTGDFTKHKIHGT